MVCQKVCHVGVAGDLCGVKELRWRPLQFRIYFKSLVLTLNTLKGQAPNYISDLSTSYIYN